MVRRNAVPLAEDFFDGLGRRRFTHNLRNPAILGLTGENSAVAPFVAIENRVNRIFTGKRKRFIHDTANEFVFFEQFFCNPDFFANAVFKIAEGCFDAANDIIRFFAKLSPANEFLAQAPAIQANRRLDGRNHLLEKFRITFRFGRTEAKHRNAEALFNRSHINLLARRFGHIHHVEHQHHGHANAHKIRQHVKTTFQLRRIYQNAHEVRLAALNVVAGDDFFFGVRRKSVTARKVNYFICRAVKNKFTFSLLHRFAGPVAHALVKSR